MKLIPLSMNHCAMVDDEDYDFLMCWKWCASKGYNTFYAVRRESDGSRVYMHRVVCPGGRQTDHRDHNGLNNQKDNLRRATHSQNTANARKKRFADHSQYRGVEFVKTYALRGFPRRWRSRITVNGKRHYLGYYATEEDAAMAFNWALAYYFGEDVTFNERATI